MSTRQSPPTATASLSANPRPWETAPIACPIAAVDRIDGYAWMRDGVLMMTSGDEFGGLTTSGFRRILRLPGPGMHLQAADAERCYVFGGNNTAQQWLRALAR